MCNQCLTYAGIVFRIPERPEYQNEIGPVLSCAHCGAESAREPASLDNIVALSLTLIFELAKIPGSDIFDILARCKFCHQEAPAHLLACPQLRARGLWAALEVEINRGLDGFLPACTCGNDSGDEFDPACPLHGTLNEEGSKE